MPEYEIMRWDAVIPKDNNLPYPMVYIKPDKYFPEFIAENKNMFLLSISGTNTDYDKIPIVGMADSSGYFPNFRPNFFNDTGYYVITLFANWLGYPPNNGKIKLQGTQGPDNIESKPPTIPDPIPVVNVPSVESYTQPENCAKLNTQQLSLLLICILVVFAVLLAISFRKKIL
jgi:hypothetical protein